MKKILLTIALIGTFLFGKSQILLNEIYTDPGNNKHEFFELYNSSVFGTGSVDCFTLITYYEESGGKTGWYVMNLPDIQIPAKGFLVGAAANPFNVQSQSTIPANFSWNSMPATGKLTKWERSGNTYIDRTSTIPVFPTLFNDFFNTVNGNGGKYVVLLYVNGVFANGLIAGSSSNTLSAAKASMPDLSVTPANAGVCVPWTASFSTLGAMENVNASGGSDNGFARSSDGKCGAWVKTSSSVSHTPGVTNGSASGLAGSLTTAQTISCNSQIGQPTIVTYNISGFTGDITLAADFPVEVQLYYDNGTPGVLDFADVYQRSKFRSGTQPAANPAVDTFHIYPQIQPVILVYKTKRGCFDKVFPLSNTCAPLPVNFKSFNANRNKSNVNLTWETSFELNNKGFEIQRKTSGNEFTTVAFVESKSKGGSSESDLSYSYTDLNATKGMSQYRLLQLDFDGKAKYTDIKSVKGEEQVSKTIVYPNPSNNGIVNIVFDDTKSIRDIQLMDMNGRVVNQWRNYSNNNIKIENLNSGFYSLRVVDQNTKEQSIEKIMINKY